LLAILTAFPSLTPLTLVGKYSADYFNVFGPLVVATHTLWPWMPPSPLQLPPGSTNLKAPAPKLIVKCSPFLLTKQVKQFFKQAIAGIIA